MVSSFPSHNDANLVTTPGLYATASGANIANLPRNAYGVLEVVGKANTTTQIQRFFTGGDAYYRRSENNNSAPYEGTTWLRIDNFGCNTPEALASLLGGVLTLGSNPSGISDANDITKTCVLVTWSNNMSNVPTGSAILMTIVARSNDYIIQYAITNSSEFYYRIKWSNSWESWKKVVSNE